MKLTYQKVNKLTETELTRFTIGVAQAMNLTHLSEGWRIPVFYRNQGGYFRLETSGLTAAITYPNSDSNSIEVMLEPYTIEHAAKYKTSVPTLDMDEVAIKIDVEAKELRMQRI